MSIELPVLRVGLAGFSAEQQDQLSALLELASSVSWQVARLAEADVWCVNGARVRVLRDSTISVDCVEPAGRSLQLDLREVDRPVAFAVPLAPRDFKPLYTFEPGSASSVGSILQKFEAWMRPLLAQFCLASCILEQESVLGPGIHHVSAEGVLIAVVNMRGETGVLPTAGPFEFENGVAAGARSRRSGGCPAAQRRPAVWHGPGSGGQSAAQSACPAGRDGTGSALELPQLEPRPHQRAS